MAHLQHSSLLHGLGSVGDVSASHLPWLLRLAHVRARISGGDSQEALQVCMPCSQATTVRATGPPLAGRERLRNTNY